MPLTKRQTKFACAAGLSLLMQYEYSKRHIRRRWWVRPWSTEDRRKQQGMAANLVPELRETDEDSFKNFFRMDPQLFDEILGEVTPHLKKEDTQMRSAVSPCEQLSVTLRLLASGASYKDLMYAFRMLDSSIATLVPKVCAVLYEVLKDEYAALPKTTVQWQQIACVFEQKWQFPHCLGAIHGKRVQIRAPASSGSTHFNYKKTFSIVLLEIADASARFTAYEVGAAGSQSDSGIFRHGSLADICKADSIPQPSKIGRREDIPYFLIGDEAFALTEHMMKPYPHRTAFGDEKIYNYRLSKDYREHLRNHECSVSHSPSNH